MKKEYGGSTWVNYSKTRALIDGYLTEEANPELVQKSLVFVFKDNQQEFDYGQSAFTTSEEAKA